MKIAIGGRPKAGTTALFYKIKNSLAREPRLLFEPERYDPDPADEDRGVLCKFLIGNLASAGLASFSGFDRKILVVRDPRDRLISEMLYSKFHAPYASDPAKCEEMLELLRQKERRPDSISVLELILRDQRLRGRTRVLETDILRGIQAAQQPLREFIARQPDYFAFKYEDMVADRFSSLERYLGFPLQGSSEVDRRVGRVVRTKASGDWRNWFLPNDVAAMRALLNPDLERLGYDTSWTLPAKQSISPAVSSEYVARLFREQPEQAPSTPLKDDGRAAKVQVRGRLGVVESRRISGWAAIPGRDQSVHVRLQVNGGREITVVADRPRPDIRHRGLHPTGACGFEVMLTPSEALQPGDVLRAFIDEAGVEIGNSPVQLQADTESTVS